MSDAQDIRRWFEEQGRPLAARGTISAEARAEYEAARLEADYAAPPAGELFPGEDDFADPAPPPADTEKRPRAIRKPSSRSRWGRPKPGAKGAKAKPKRVPVDDLIATIWRGVAGMARPLPATSRLLKVQAPVAGAILEDVVKGTIVDTVLQPIARTSEGAEALIVLAGPPVLVAAMEMDPAKIPVCMPILRELLLRWCKIAGPKMADAMRRENEFEEQFGQSVDDLLALLQRDMPAEEEDQAVRDAQDAMQGTAA